MSAPYVHVTSARLARNLLNYDVNISSPVTNTLRQQLCNLRDRWSAEDEADVVHDLKCNDWDSVYVGETGRTLKMRMS